MNEYPDYRSQEEEEHKALEEKEKNKRTTRRVSYLSDETNRTLRSNEASFIYSTNPFEDGGRSSLSPYY